MDSLFLVLLALFFAQGLWGGKHPAVRAIAFLFLGGLAVAFVYALR